MEDLKTKLVKEFLERNKNVSEDQIKKYIESGKVTFLVKYKLEKDQRLFEECLEIMRKDMLENICTSCGYYIWDNDQKIKITKDGFFVGENKLDVEIISKGIDYIFCCFECMQEYLYKHFVYS